jgi:hypothetical protein
MASLRVVIIAGTPFEEWVGLCSSKPHIIDQGYAKGAVPDASHRRLGKTKLYPTPLGGVL